VTTDRSERLRARARCSWIEGEPKAQGDSQMIVRRFVETPAGTLHCAIAGTGRPVLLLHQTPRSWDEYRDVLPLLGRDVQAIAVDTIGFGDSCKPPLDHDSIEHWAAVSVGLLDTLGIERFAVVGHHTGAVIATEIAAAFPQRVDAAVLSASALVDAAFRARHSQPSGVDNVRRKADGSHLTELWRIRQQWYPRGDIDLLERFVVDALKAGPRAAEGHAVVARYVMETRLPLIRCPVLVMAPTEDPHAYPQARPLAQAIAGSRYVEIEGGMVPLPDQMPEAFARHVLEFLRSVPAASREGAVARLLDSAEGPPRHAVKGVIPS
jgi:pimeloyl-ACP methyl ester carboxylesterase